MRYCPCHSNSCHKTHILPISHSFVLTWYCITFDSISFPLHTLLDGIVSCSIRVELAFLFTFSILPSLVSASGAANSMVASAHVDSAGISLIRSRILSVWERVAKISLHFSVHCFSSSTATIPLKGASLFDQSNFDIGSNISFL